MDIASILGLVICLGLVVFSIVDGKGVSALMNFVDRDSVLITFGGAFCCILAEKTMDQFKRGIKSFKLVLKKTEYDTAGVIRKIIDLSNVARKEGLLSLEEAAGDVNDAFLKKGILLIVDGTDPELVRAIMETEMASCEDRHKENISFWEDLGAMGPA
mgnify:FL=1